MLLQDWDKPPAAWKPGITNIRRSRNRRRSMKVYTVDCT
jgi:hypothetical protein